MNKNVSKNKTSKSSAMGASIRSKLSNKDMPLSRNPNKGKFTKNVTFEIENDSLGQIGGGIGDSSTIVPESQIPHGSVSAPPVADDSSEQHEMKDVRPLKRSGRRTKSSAV